MTAPVSQRPRRWAVAAAWCVTAGILGYLLWRVPLGDVLAQMQRAAGWSLFAGVLALSAIFVADSVATWSTFSRLTGPLSLKGVCLARGASYLLAALNYVAGQGALLYFVRRSREISSGRAAGVLLIIAGSNFALLLVLAAAGVAFAHEVPAGLPTFLGLSGVAGLCFAGLLIARPQRLARFDTVRVLFDAGLGGHAWATFVRVPHVLALMAYSLAMLHGFGVHVPLSQALIGLPIVYVVAFLPISVQGLGTSQAVMIALFARYAEGDAPAREATVLASSLSAFALMTAFQWALGAICLRTSLGKELRQVS